MSFPPPFSNYRTVCTRYFVTLLFTALSSYPRALNYLGKYFTCIPSFVMHFVLRTDSCNLRASHSFYLSQKHYRSAFGFHACLSMHILCSFPFEERCMKYVCTSVSVTSYWTLGLDEGRWPFFRSQPRQLPANCPRP